MSWTNPINLHTISVIPYLELGWYSISVNKLVRKSDYFTRKKHSCWNTSFIFNSLHSCLSCTSAGSASHQKLPVPVEQCDLGPPAGQVRINGLNHSYVVKTDSKAFLVLMTSSLIERHIFRTQSTKKSVDMKRGDAGCSLSSVCVTGVSHHARAGLVSQISSHCFLGKN